MYNKIGEIMEEIWKQIEGYPYIISNKGRVRNVAMNRALIPYMDKDRLKVTFYKNCQRYSRNLASLVYHYFIHPIGTKAKIGFKDGDVKNCSADNLILSERVFKQRMIKRKGQSKKTPVLNSKKREGLKELPFAIETSNYIPYADNCTVRAKGFNPDAYLLRQFTYNY